jgi:glycosyltransferase involved in cell wall biosynthesis
MAAGLPVVATDVGANTKLLKASGVGRVVPTGDMNQFEAALLELIDDPDTRAVMGQAAREHVEQEYSRDAMRKRFEEFYRTLTGRA